MRTRCTWPTTPTRTPPGCSCDGTSSTSARSRPSTPGSAERTCGPSRRPASRTPARGSAYTAKTLARARSRGSSRPYRSYERRPNGSSSKTSSALRARRRGERSSPRSTRPVTSGASTTRPPSTSGCRVPGRGTTPWRSESPSRSSITPRTLDHARSTASPSSGGRPSFVRQKNRFDTTSRRPTDPRPRDLVREGSRSTSSDPSTTRPSRWRPGRWRGTGDGSTWCRPRASGAPRSPRGTARRCTEGPCSRPTRSSRNTATWTLVPGARGSSDRSRGSGLGRCDTSRRGRWRICTVWTPGGGSPRGS